MKSDLNLEFYIFSVRLFLYMKLCDLITSVQTEEKTSSKFCFFVTKLSYVTCTSEASVS